MRVITKVLDPSLIRAFADTLASANLAPASLRGYASDLEVFRGWLEASHGAPVEVHAITGDDLVGFRKHLTGILKQRRATVNRRVQALRRFFGWLEQEGLVPSDPSGAIRFLRRQAPRQPDTLTAKEVQALLRAAGQSVHGLAARNYAMVRMLLETGLRAGELVALRVRDCNIGGRFGTVEVVGGRQRTVMLPAVARRAVVQYLQTRSKPRSGDPLFTLGSDRTRLSIRAVQATIQGLARRAAITRVKVSANTLRRTFSKGFLANHLGQVEALAKVLGCETTDTVAIYERPSSEARRTGQLPAGSGGLKRS